MIFIVLLTSFIIALFIDHNNFTGKILYLLVAKWYNNINTLLNNKK